MTAIEIVREQKRKEDRKRMILAMEFIARHISDENIFWDEWSRYGVADGDIPYGSGDIDNVEDIYIEDENYEDIVHTFMFCMKQAFKNGGLESFY